MSTKIEQNTTDLQAILDAVNALPEAGSGSGGGSVETCTLEIIADAPVMTTKIAYLDGNNAICELEVSPTDLMLGITISCKANSFVLADAPIFADNGGFSSGDLETYNANTLLVRSNGTFVIS